jgi:hypothetical protein
MLELQDIIPNPDTPASPVVLKPPLDARHVCEFRASGIGDAMLADRAAAGAGRGVTKSPIKTESRAETRIVVELRPSPDRNLWGGVPVAVRVRRLLKFAIRVSGLVAVQIREGGE